MVKIKIYTLSSGHREFKTRWIPVTDYCYCVYLFGFLIHSVTLHDIHPDSVKTIFGSKEIISND